MNRRTREKQEKRTGPQTPFAEPPSRDIAERLSVALMVDDTANCALTPGVWRPAVMPIATPEPVQTDGTEADEAIACEGDPIDEITAAADTPSSEIDEDETEAPFLLAIGEWIEREPVLLDHGPDMTADDPFGDLLAVADMLYEDAAASVASLNEPDPDLRELILASRDATVVEAMALGDADAALSAFERNGAAIRSHADNLRARLATTMRAEVGLTEDQKRDVTFTQLRNAIANLVADADGIGAASARLEAFAVNVGNGYRAACAESDRVLGDASASWPRLNVAVCLHVAAKTDATAEAIASFRAMARRVIADDAHIATALDARSAAETRIGDMHHTWQRERGRALEIRKNLQSATSACQILGISETAFAGLVEAGLRSCRTHITAMDTHKSLVAILPTDIPEPVAKVRALLPQIRELLDRLDQRTGEDLSKVVILGYHLIVKDRRGKTVRGVCRVLVHAGLLAENDVTRAESAVDPYLKTLFVKSARQRFDLYSLNERGHQLAAGIAARQTDLPDVERRIDAAKEAARADQVAIRERWLSSVRERTERSA